MRTTTKGETQLEAFRFSCVKGIEHPRKGDLGEIEKIYSAQVLLEKQVNFSKFANS